MIRRAKCRFSNFANGISPLFAFTRPGASFMDASNARNCFSRDGTIGARTMKLAWGVIASFELIEDLVSGRFVVGNLVHRMPQSGESQVHPASGAALIAQRTMLGDRVPRIIGKLLREGDLGRGIELLLRQTQG